MAWVPDGHVPNFESAFRASLKGDRKRMVEDAGKDVEALLGGDPPNVKEVWRQMKGWYKAAVNRAPSPAQATLEWITVERFDLYSHMPTPGDNIPVTSQTDYLLGTDRILFRNVAVRDPRHNFDH